MTHERLVKAAIEAARAVHQDERIEDSRASLDRIVDAITNMLNSEE